VRTPNRRVILLDANDDDIATVPVPGLVTRIRIWINHPTEPDEVTIAIAD